MFLSKTMNPKRLNDYKFPIILSPGSVGINLYELTYNRKSQYLYTSIITKYQRENQDPYLHCHFIRRQNMVRFLKESSELGNLLKNFRLKILLNYINKILLPIERDKHLHSLHKEIVKRKLQIFFRSKVQQLE